MDGPSRRNLGTRTANNPQSIQQQQQQPPAAVDPDEARLLLELQRNIDWSIAWWHGRDRWWKHEHAAGRREPIYRRIPVPPPPRPPRGTHPPPPPLRQQQNPNVAPPGFFFTAAQTMLVTPPPPVSLSQRRAAQYEQYVAGTAQSDNELRKLAEDVEAGREFGHVMSLVRGTTGLQFKKILGRGGQGIVALFEVGDVNGNGGTKVVIKGLLKDEAWMKSFLIREKRNVLVS